jgi:MFS family permease
MVLPSLYGFVKRHPDDKPPGLGQSDQFYGFAIAISSVSELISILVVGFIARRVKLRILFFFASLVGLSGFILYIFTVSPTMLIISRILTGIWAGSHNLLVRIWISGFIEGKQITQTFNIMGVSGCIGSAIAPYIGACFIGIDLVFKKTFYLNDYNAPGYILAIFCFAELFLVWIIYEPDKSQTDEQNREQQNLIQSDFNTPLPPAYWSNGGHTNTLILIILFSFFCASVGFTVVESAATPLVENALNFGIKQTGTLFLIGGICNVITFIAQTIAIQKKWVTSIQLLIMSLFLSVTGSLLMSDMWQISPDKYKNSTFCLSLISKDICLQSESCSWNSNVEKCMNLGTSYVNWLQYYFGFAAIQISYPSGRVGATAVYGLLLGAKNKNAFMNSILVALGSIARILGPFFAVWLLDIVKWHTFLLSTVLFVIFLTCTLCLLPKYVYITNSIKKIAK